MELTDLTLEVRDAQLRRGGIISLKDADLELRPTYCNVGTWSLTLPLEHPTVPILRKPGGGIVLTGPDGQVLTSGPMVKVTSAASSKDPEGLVTFEGITDEHVLGDALAFPVPSSPTMEGQTAAANDIRVGPIETVMHGFVSANIGPAAPAPRRNVRLDMGPDLGRGVEVRKTARFPKLGSLLAEVATLGDVGFRVIQRGERLVFETFEVQDRSKEIRMDLWNNTIASYEINDIGAAVTHVFVAGQEEGVLRQLLERTTPESIEQEALWGRRIERFLDQRHTDDVKELEQAGDEVLTKEGVGQSLVKFTPMDEHTMRFLYDWNLGDKVTAVIEGREVAAIVSAAIIKIDKQGVRVACALGNLETGLDSSKAFATRTEQRLSALERTNEASTSGGVYTVKSDAEQAKLVSALMPNDKAPLIVHRADAVGPTPTLRVTADGILWSNITTSPAPAPWIRPSLTDGWSDYGRGYAQAGYLRLASGIVVLGGLIQGGKPGEAIFTLPEGYRPDVRRIHYSSTAANSGAAGRIDVYPDGRVVAVNPDPGWTSLDGIMFPAAGVATWTPLEIVQGFLPENVEGNGVPSYWQDPHGRVWLQGAITRPNTPTDDYAFAKLPVELAPAQQLHLGAITFGNIGGGLDVAPKGTTTSHLPNNPSLRYKKGSNVAWMSLASFMWTPALRQSMTDYPAMTGGWGPYNVADFPSGQYQVHADGLVQHQGLIRGGTFGSAAGTMPAGARAGHDRRLFTVAAANLWARADTTGAGEIVPLNGSAAWFSLSQINYVLEN